MASGNQFNELSRLGQSMWYDNIERRLLDDGTIRSMVDKGEIRGITSNPTIFCKAITGRSEYDPEIQAFVTTRPNADVKELYELLMASDIRRAADFLRPVYDRTKGEDGYVSIEVSPKLAYRTLETIEEAKRLHKMIGRPNVMVKVPATAEGIEAFSTLIRDGIPINVTLIFSHADYRAVASAYMTGLEARLQSGRQLADVASVASFFVSRLESKVDKAVPETSPVRGKVAVAYSKLTYQEFDAVLRSERWKALQKRGARIQRLLWGSTGTKNPSYPDLLYVENLIGPNTVNTVPPETLTAFRDHGKAALTVTQNLEEATLTLSNCLKAGVDLDRLTADLKKEGVASFEKSFDDLIEALSDAKKRFQL